MGGDAVSLSSELGPVHARPDLSGFDGRDLMVVGGRRDAEIPLAVAEFRYGQDVGAGGR